jgi:hypothetical protein
MKVNGCDSSRAFGPKVHALRTGLHLNYGKNKAIPVKLIAQRKGPRHITLQRARNNVHTKVSFVIKRVALTQIKYKAIDKFVRDICIRQTSACVCGILWDLRDPCGNESLDDGSNFFF